MPPTPTPPPLSPLATPRATPALHASPDPLSTDTSPRALHIRLALADTQEQARLQRYLVGHGHAVSGSPGWGGSDVAMAGPAADVFLVQVVDWPPDPSRAPPDTRPGVAATVCLCDPAPGRRAAALEAGADDCLSRPYEARELMARLAALRRRCLRTRSIDCAGGAPRHAFGAWQMDLRSRRLMHASGRHVTLTETEWRLLRVFLQRPRLALTREHLHAQALQAASPNTAAGLDATDRNVDLLVSRLRHKLADTATRPGYIHTIRGVGYLFDAFQV